jgi:hypothetical protein
MSDRSGLAHHDLDISWRFPAMSNRDLAFNTSFMEISQQIGPPVIIFSVNYCLASFRLLWSRESRNRCNESRLKNQWERLSGLRRKFEVLVDTRAKSPSGKNMLEHSLWRFWSLCSIVRILVSFSRQFLSMDLGGCFPVTTPLTFT